MTTSHLQPNINVSVLGAGSWGTALAVLSSRKHQTLIWARDADVVRSINQSHTNPRYLNDIPLPDKLLANNNFNQTVDYAANSENGLIILGVPVAALQSTCTMLAKAIDPNKCAHLSVLLTSKGLQEQSGLLPHQVALSQLQDHIDNGMGLGVLSGPSFAKEVALGLPVALTVAALDTNTPVLSTQALHGEVARIYSSNDIVGVEIGGALKNVIAVACGISDGLQLGDNARAALITRGLHEIQQLGLALGGKAETFFGLTGLGDLVLTTTGSLSRNRQVGLELGQGKNLNEILASGITAEGVRCAKSVLNLAQKHNIELPIIESVNQILFNGLSPNQAVNKLLSRQAKAEHDYTAP